MGYLVTRMGTMGLKRGIQAVTAVFRRVFGRQGSPVDPVAMDSLWRQVRLLRRDLTRTNAVAVLAKRRSDAAYTRAGRTQASNTQTEMNLPESGAPTLPPVGIPAGNGVRAGTSLRNRRP